MTQNPTASDWMSTRGEKWRANMVEMEASLAPVDAPLLAALALDAPYRIADIGCGGGATSLELLRQAPRGSQIVGLDISPAMVEAANARIPPAETRLRFELADVGSAAKPAQLYERMGSRFGVMFFDDPASAFANLRQWLAPRGRIAFAVWASPDDNHWFLSVREVVARLVELPKPEPDAPGPYRYADVEKLLSVLRGAGFSDVAAQPFRTELPVGGTLSPEQAARFTLGSFSTFAELLTHAGEHALSSAQTALSARFQTYYRDGAVRLPASVHIVTALRP